MKSIAALSLLFTAALAAQDVTVKQVNDRRTMGSFAALSISLELPKVKSSDVAASRVLVASAVDETGRDLVDAEAGEPQLQVHMGGRPDDNPASVSLQLKNPDRKANSVKEVRGEIELLMPSKDPNSIAEIAKFMTTTGKPLSHKALKANGVEITLVTPAQLEAEKKKRAEAKKKEYAEMGFEGEALESMLKDFLSSLFDAQENEVPVRIKDPNGRILDIAYVDAAGDVKIVTTQEQEGGMAILSTWAGKPQPDWKLRVSMKTPKNVVRVPFTLANVPLP